MKKKFIPETAAIIPWTDKCVQKGAATIQGLECVFANIVAAALGFAAIVLFVMFVIGGFRYLTSGGDPKAVEAARGTITHAIAGLIILLLAFIIILIIGQLTGLTDILTKFSVVTE